MSAEADAIRQMFETVSLGAPENAIGFVLWRITVRYQREMDRALSVLDLTHLQFVSLALAAQGVAALRTIHVSQTDSQTGATIAIYSTPWLNARPWAGLEVRF